MRIVKWGLKRIMNLSKQDLEFGLSESPPNACPTTISEGKGDERVNFLLCRQWALVRLEPSFGQKPFRCGEVFLNVTDYEMREYDVRLRKK
jgi:hypothetical protein